MYNLYFESQLALKVNSKYFRSVYIRTDLGKKKPNPNKWPLVTEHIR